MKMAATRDSMLAEESAAMASTAVAVSSLRLRISCWVCRRTVALSDLSKEIKASSASSLNLGAAVYFQSLGTILSIWPSLALPLKPAPAQAAV